MSAENEIKMAHSAQTPPHLKARSPAAGLAQVTAFLTDAPAVPGPAREPPDHNATPSPSFAREDGELPSCEDRATQTEWVYESRAALKSKLKTKRKSTTWTLPSATVDSEAMEFISQEDFWAGILKEPADTLGSEDFDDNLLDGPFPSVPRAIIEEVAACSELDEDVEIPLPGHLDSKTRRKLGVLLKKRFQKHKKTILHVMKDRSGSSSPKAAEGSTYTFHLGKQLPHVEKPEPEGAKEPGPAHRRKDLEMETEWVRSPVQVPQGDVKLMLYPNESIFQILFPDGSGQIHYPSGRLAMLTVSTKERKLTYIVLDDGEDACVRALVTNTGHATIYDENREIWLSLSQVLGYYFPKGRPQKAWNWWDLSLHVHAPPVQSISLNVNQYIEVHIRSQDNIAFCFTHRAKHICLNLGTKYKVVAPELLRELGAAAALEADCSPTARRVHVLLGHMSRTLHLLPASDLEDFLEAAEAFLDCMSPEKLSHVLVGSRPTTPGLCQCLPRGWSRQGRRGTPQSSVF